MAARQLTTPVGGGQLAGGPIEIASQVARVLESFRSDFLDRLQERTLQKILRRIPIDTTLDEYLQQGPPISQVNFILKCGTLRNSRDELGIAAIRCRLRRHTFAIGHGDRLHSGPPPCFTDARSTLLRCQRTGIG